LFWSRKIAFRCNKYRVFAVKIDALFSMTDGIIAALFGEYPPAKGWFGSCWSGLFVKKYGPFEVLIGGVFV
jgi:hypothetical protein